MSDDKNKYLYPNNNSANDEIIIHEIRYNPLLLGKCVRPMCQYLQMIVGQGFLMRK